MSLEEKQQKKLVSDLNALLVRNVAEPHDIPVGDNEYLRVWVKPITFLQKQRAVKEVVSLNGTTGEVGIDLEAYWKHMLTTCVERCEPEMSKAQMLSLRSDILERITSLLPQPQDLIAGPLLDGETE